MFERVAGPAALAAWLLLCAPAAAQTGNLISVGRFDSAGDVGAWSVASPQISSLAFDASADCDGCLTSGVALGTCDSPVDFGTASFSVCLEGIPVSVGYRMSGEFRFPSNVLPARANLTLLFYPVAGCQGTDLGGGFAGYAQSAVAGWQHLESGSLLAPEATASAWFGVLLTQLTGSDPAVQVQFDEIRLTTDGWVFAEDFEADETCRWDAATL